MIFIILIIGVVSIHFYLKYNELKQITRQQMKDIKINKKQIEQKRIENKKIEQKAIEQKAIEQKAIEQKAIEYKNNNIYNDLKESLLNELNIKKK